MGKVHYKFVYNSEIDFPESIEFDGIPADLKDDTKENFTIEGDVNDAALDSENKLPVFVSSSGRTGRTWNLEVKYDEKKLSIFPILGTIGGNGFYTLNKRYNLIP